jgi:hypothetical protein
MKHSKLILTLASLAFLSMGCAKDFKTTENTTTVTPDAPGVVDPTFPEAAPPGQGVGTAGDDWGYGSTTTFIPDSLDIMSIYVGGAPNSPALNNPTNFKLNVNVYDVGGGHFGGQIKLRYEDVGQVHEGYFVAGTGKNTDFDSYGTAKDVGAYESQYNTWLNATQFSGYFQDAFGAIVLVIDGTGPDLGDGKGSTTVTGSVWFKNFTLQFPSQGAERYCWFIYRGPYQCRTSTVLDNKSVPYPSDGYRRLGTFTSLTRAKAFNQ